MPACFLSTCDLFHRFFFDTRIFARPDADYSGLGFSISADYNDLIGGSCTSCEVSQDKSAYWTPGLYFQSASGQFTLVNQVGGMLAYVLTPLVFGRVSSEFWSRVKPAVACLPLLASGFLYDIARFLQQRKGC
jgi:hypothetical protein